MWYSFVWMEIKMKKVIKITLKNSKEELIRLIEERLITGEAGELKINIEIENGGFIIPDGWEKTEKEGIIRKKDNPKSQIKYMSYRYGGQGFEAYYNGCVVKLNCDSLDDAMRSIEQYENEEREGTNEEELKKKTKAISLFYQDETNVDKLFVPEGWFRESEFVIRQERNNGNVVMKSEKEKNKYSLYFDGFLIEVKKELNSAVKKIERLQQKKAQGCDMSYLFD
jgi:hypothetical protein